MFKSYKYMCFVLKAFRLFTKTLNTLPHHTFINSVQEYSPHKMVIIVIINHHHHHRRRRHYYHYHHWRGYTCGIRGTARILIKVLER